jgi:hypothetical protein
MKIIEIEATESTPRILFDHINYKFEFIGEASPEDAKHFFNPLFTWMDELYSYIHYAISQNSQAKSHPINFVVHIDYITSSSLKCLYDILKKIVKLKELTPDVQVTWLYDHGDDDMKENGEEFATMLQIPFIIKEAQ